MTSCCITRSYRKARHRLGTVYGAYTLNAQDTGINCCGTLTITLPAVPSDGQTITINNVCTGTVTVTDGVSSWEIAAGESGTFYTAGSQYISQHSLPTTSGAWFSVVYGAGIFVAVTRNDSKAAYSSDGITWVETALPSAALWRDVLYGHGVFVTFDDNGNVAHSADGITWNSASFGTSGVTWQTMTVTASGFVAVSGHTVLRSARSSNGSAWTLTTTGTTISRYCAIGCVMSGSRCLVVYSGAVTARFRYSDDDGATWSAEGNTGLTDVVADTTRHILTTASNTALVLTYGASAIALKSDASGLVWEYVGMPFGDKWWSAAIGVDPDIMAISVDENAANGTADGATWINGATLNPLDNVSGITYGNGGYLIVGGADNNIIHAGTGWTKL